MRLSKAPHRFLDYSEKVSPGLGATPPNKFSSSILSIGKVFERGTREFDEFFRPDKQAEDQYDFSTPELLPGARSVIWIDITQVGLSCGYTVPIMIFEKHRKYNFYLLKYATQFLYPAYISVVRTGDTHTKFAARLEERDSATDDPFSLPPDKGMMSYMVAMNTWSIDGLPGMMQNAERATKENIRKTMVKYGLTPPGSRNLQFKWLQGERIGLVLVGIVLGIIVTILVQLSSSPKVWRLSKPVLCVGRYCLPMP